MKTLIMILSLYTGMSLIAKADDTEYAAQPWYADVDLDAPSMILYDVSFELTMNDGLVVHPGYLLVTQDKNLFLLHAANTGLIPLDTALITIISEEIHP